MTVVDFAFSIQTSSAMAADHGYHLYAALSRTLPTLHETNGIAVHPIRGQQIGGRKIVLNDRSRLVIRTPAERIVDWLPLAGKQLEIGDCRLRVGVPQVWSLCPATALRSRLVTIKVKDAGDDAANLTPDLFAAAARRQLAALGISPEAALTLGKRRTLRIKSKEVVGYELLLSALSPEESLTLQEHHLGGRHLLGCGVFVPFNQSEVKHV